MGQKHELTDDLEPRITVSQGLISSDTSCVSKVDASYSSDPLTASTVVIYPYLWLGRRCWQARGPYLGPLRASLGEAKPTVGAIALLIGVWD